VARIVDWLHTNGEADSGKDRRLASYEWGSG